jgi:uncharacterized repeat protein (TIGR01451 family)
MSAKFGEFRRGRGRRWWYTGATLVVVAVFSVVFVAASGANLNSSPFEGADGNMVVDTNGHTDWESLSPPVLRTLPDVASGSSDNSFTQGSKEDDPNVTIAEGSIPPNKNDLTRAYAATETVGGDTFLYLAWERQPNPNGSANIDFELNQATTSGDFTSPGDLTINRTAGDLLITYDFSGSGTPDLGLLTWITSGSNSQCEASGAKVPCWGNRVDVNPGSNPAGEAGVNSDTIDEVFAGGQLSAGSFGEAKIDLSQVPGIFSSDTCKAFGSMFVKSRSSGSSIDAELKDFIAPAPIHLTNCGSIELKKHWVGGAGNATLNIGTSAGAHDTAQTSVSGEDGTTGSQTVENGTYYVSESVDNSGDYSSSLSCTDNGQNVTPGNDNSLSVSQGHEVVCTFTNTHKGSIELKKHWVGTAGSATLNIGTSQGGSEVATATANGSDGTTGAKSVDTGTYYVSESVTNAGDYTSTLACTDNGQSVTPGAGNSLTVGENHTVVCTYTNTRKQGSIELKKHWVGTAGSATLNIGTSAGGHEVAQATANGSDGTTGAKSVDTGTYYVSESVTNAGDYTSTLACTDNGQSVTPGGDGSLSVAQNHTVVCTYTNTRKQGSIELKKHWVGTAGSATLNIGTSQGGSQVATATANGSDGTTGAKTVDTGTYYVSESVTNPGDYASELACTDNGQSVTPGGDGSLSVAQSHTVVCTYTNTRKQGSIELKKHWVGTAGSATLNIGTSQGGHQVAQTTANGSDGTTGAKAVNTGTYFVSESVTNASDYVSDLACADESGPVSVGQDGSVAVADGAHVVCTYTNTHKGSIELKKHWVGTAGDVTLAIGTTAGGDDVATKALSGSDGTTGAKTVDAATYYVSETLANPDAYVAGLACTDNGNPVTPGQNGSVAVANAHTVVCTYTNTRKQGSIELKKHWVGTAGNATLNVGTSAGGHQVAQATANGSDGTTGAQTVNTGTYFVSESVDNSTDYVTQLACVDDTGAVSVGQDGSVAVGAGEHVVCTYTNTHKGSIELKKHWVGGAGDVTLAIGTTAGGDDVASKSLSDDGTTGAQTVPAGTYFVSESLDNADLYNTELSCTDNGQPVTAGADGSVDVGNTHTVVCTYTNSRLPTIEIVKSLNPASDAGTFDFAIDETTFNNDGSGYGDQGSTGDVPVQPSEGYAISESGHGDTNLSDYGSTWSCSNEQSGDGTSFQLAGLGYGDSVTCTFVNTKLAALIVVKKVDNSNGGGSKGPGDFTLHAKDKNGADLAGSPAKGSSSGTTYSGLMPGLYTVSENSVSGYTLTKNTCGGGVNLAAGQTVTCTLTNTSNPPSTPPPTPPPVTPPPPPPPPPVIDLAVTKAGAPNPVTVGKNVRWTMVVTNNGPNDATGVTLADPVPPGTTFVSVATSQGTCTGSQSIVNCNLGTIPVGSSVTISMVTTAAATGALTNVVTVVGNQTDSNTNNNKASATVQAKGPFVPPPVYCTAVSVKTKQLFVGRATVITLRIAQHGKHVQGVRVKIAGKRLGVVVGKTKDGKVIVRTPNAKTGLTFTYLAKQHKWVVRGSKKLKGLIVTTPSAKNGVVKIRVYPQKAGIVTFIPFKTKSCANPRVGVTGVFTPPVTG